MAGLPTRLARLLRHRWWDEADARRVLPASALARVAARVAASEALHSGEIRVCIEPGLPLSYLWRGLLARDRAVTLFGKLRVWDTEHNNGVLVYLLLADRAIEVVADRGLNQRFSPAQWQALVDTLGADLRAGRFEPGLIAAVDAVNALLIQHFALAPGQANANELPDAPLVL